MRWSAVKAFMIKDLKTTFRNKADIFWIFAWPAIWLLMTAFVFIPPTAGQPMTLTLGAVNHDATSLPVNGTLLIKIFNESTYHGIKFFDVKLYENESLMLEDLRRGRLDGGIIIPEGFGRELIFGQGSLEICVGARDPQTAQMTEYMLKGFIQELNKKFSTRKINETLRYMELYAEEYFPKNISISFAGNLSWIEFMREWMLGIASPINANFHEVKPKALMERASIIGWYTFGALGMSILYSGLLTGSLMAVEEKERRTLRRLLASPATSTDMLAGKTLASLLVLAFMSGFMIVLGIFGCGARIFWNPARIEDWIAASMIILVALMMIGLGMLLSLITKTVRSATNLSVVLGLMLAFTAGIWFPKWWMPEWMQVLAEVFPGTWAIDVARSILVYEVGLMEVIGKVLETLLVTAAIYLLGVLAYKKTLRRYAEA